MASKLYGVLTADVVQSRARRNLRPLLTNNLRRASAAHQAGRWIDLPYAVAAGDEFQTITSNPAQIPALVLDLRTRLRPLDIWVGIGIGRVTGRIRAPVNRLTGEAFEFARTALEAVKEDNRTRRATLTAVRLKDTELADTCNLLYGVLDNWLLRISAKQWRTICAYLEKKRRLAPASRSLGVNVSTVSRNLKRAHYRQIEATRDALRFILRRCLPPS